MQNRIKENLSDRLFMALIYTMLSIVMLVIIYPLIYIVSASFSSASAVVAGKVWLWPVEPTLIGYEAIFQSKLIMNGYLNTIIITVVGTLVNLIVTVMAAYPLSRKDFFGRDFFMGMFLLTTLFSGGLIPSFLLVKSLGLYDTRMALIIPTALSVWNMIITRTYFQTSIPEELYEASCLDGCSDLRYIVSVVLPLSKPILAVIGMYYAVGHWNSYFNALIYLKTQQLYPLQIVLRNILINYSVNSEIVYDIHLLEKQREVSELLRYSVIVVASVPVLMLYPFVQKYFVKGVMIGSLKG